MSNHSPLARALSTPAESIADALQRVVNDPNVSAADMCLAAVDQHDARTVAPKGHVNDEAYVVGEFPPALVALADVFRIESFPDDAELYRVGFRRGSHIIVRGSITPGRAVVIRARDGRVLLDTSAWHRDCRVWTLRFELTEEQDVTFLVVSEAQEELRAESEEAERFNGGPLLDYATRGDGGQVQLHQRHDIGPFARYVDRQLRGPIQ
ncbi:hypothetical protein [Fontivita pretiosa]|uniref:hypothetical protein n=1 Tax=Fontivita pretiosa TaxID=2989684 RepID=UPI003D176717